MIIHSIRNRIQIWHTTLLAAIISSLLTAFYFHEKEIKIREFDNQLSAPITSLIPHLIPSPKHRTNYKLPQHIIQQRRRLLNESAEETQQRRNSITQHLVDAGHYVLSYDAKGNLIYKTPNTPTNYTPQNVDQTNLPTFNSPTNKPLYSKIQSNGIYRECIHTGQHGYKIIIGITTATIDAQLSQLRTYLIATGIGVILIGHTIGWLLVGRSLRPIQSITKTAQNIASGDLQQRINISHTESELGQMAQVLNSTFNKLENAFEQQIRFTADASHELRTPIAVILSKCQFALLRERSLEKYQQALTTCEASAQHIRQLVDSLLELARVDSGEFQLQLAQADLATTIQNAVELLRSLAEEKEIELTTQIDACKFTYDPDRMQQVAINLISNAIKYTQQGGSVHVQLTKQAKQAILQVTDNGPGIPPADIPNLFNRFYRVDKERPDSKTSSGLGLAITKAIVDAHNAQITIDSQINIGSTFTVTLPMHDNPPHTHTA